MTADDLIKLLGQGGVTAALLFVVARLLMKLFEQNTAALAKLVDRIDHHTQVDLEHHAEVRQAIVRVEGKVDAALDWQERTPVEGPPIPHRRSRTNPQGYPAGYYAPKRPPSDSDR